MDLEQEPSWSKGDLRRLGEALVIDKTATPQGCPQYGDVMRWHNDLAAEVAIRIAVELWAAVPPDQLSISARAKTVDTLVQKLQRTTLKLSQVVDLAGVRVDADMVLHQQTDLAQEIAEYFGAARATIKDIRATPHSGYRAVHVWLALPAGRVEVQIRTLPQSEWANLYEACGESYGRGIRYGEEQEDAIVRRVVDVMHDASAVLAEAEARIDGRWLVERGVEALSPDTPRHADLLAKGRAYLERDDADGYTAYTEQLKSLLEKLRATRRFTQGLTKGELSVEAVKAYAASLSDEGRAYLLKELRALREEIKARDGGAV
jgi:ppGpp synthetase/RelA/SpoT-type nucleotidyltranferase